MRCSQIEGHLLSLVDDRLVGPEREVVEAHLADCSACRDALEEMFLAREALGALAPVRAPASFAPRVKAAVRAEVEKTYVPAAFLQPLRTWLPSAALGLMAFAALSWYVSGPERTYVAPAGRTIVRAQAVAAAPSVARAAKPTAAPAPSSREAAAAGRREPSLVALYEPRRELNALVRAASSDGLAPKGASATVGDTRSKTVLAKTGVPDRPRLVASPTPSASSGSVAVLAATDARLLETGGAAETPAVFDAALRGLEAPPSAPRPASAPVARATAAPAAGVTLVSLVTDQGLDGPSM